MKNQLIFGHIFTLTLGSLIYLLFRSSSLLMFKWVELFGLNEVLNKIRKATTPFSGKIPDWILFSLPDGLWIFSYISLLLFIWRNSISIKNIFWILIIPILAIFSEIGQLLKILPGIFDIYDIILYLLGMILPLVFFYKTININFKIQ